MRRALCIAVLLIASFLAASVTIDITAFATETVLSAGYSIDLGRHIIGGGISKPFLQQDSSRVTLWVLWEMEVESEASFNIGIDGFVTVWPPEAISEGFWSTGPGLCLHMGTSNLKVGMRLTGEWLNKVEWFIKARVHF